MRTYSCIGQIYGSKWSSWPFYRVVFWSRSSRDQLTDVSGSRMRLNHFCHFCPDYSWIHDHLCSSVVLHSRLQYALGIKLRGKISLLLSTGKELAKWGVNTGNCCYPVFYLYYAIWSASFTKWHPEWIIFISFLHSSNINGTSYFLLSLCILITALVCVCSWNKVKIVLLLSHWSSQWGLLFSTDWLIHLIIDLQVYID